MLTILLYVALFTCAVSFLLATTGVLMASTQDTVPKSLVASVAISSVAYSVIVFIMLVRLTAAFTGVTGG